MTKKFTVKDPSGFHARPATVFVQEVSKHECDVTIAYKGTEVNAKSIMGVMSLGIKANDEFEITADDAAIVAIEKALKDNGLV